MRKGNWTASLLAATVLLALGTTPVVAQSVPGGSTGEVLGDDYADGDFGRLAYQENGVTIRRASTESDPSLERVAGLNAPIFPGDGLMTAFDQRAEIQLAGGSLVRVDRASDLTFLALPDPYAEIADNTILQLQQGTIRIQALLANDSEFRIDSPAASIFLLGDADVRIEADEDGSTRVASRRGVVEVSANGGSVLVRGGNETVIYPGGGAENPIAFNTLRTDSFDRWVYEREALWSDQERYADNSDAYEALPSEVRPYYRELSANGRWAYVDEIGWSWYPTGVASDWRPYNDGYWSYGDRGYFWVSHERWGWAPYHYGRWHFNDGFGWGWIPGRTFGGAWVAWSWGSAYLGWSPLGFWNTPYCGSAWAYNYGYYGPSWTFLNYNYLGRRNYRRFAVGYARLGSRHLNGAAVVTRPPRVGPGALARSADLRQGAIRQARANRAAAIRPVSRADRGRSTLPDVDRRLASMRGDRATASRGGRTGRIVDSGRSGDRGTRRTPQSAVGRRSLNGDERATKGRGTSLQRRSNERQTTPGRTTDRTTGRRTTRPTDDRAVRGSGSNRGRNSSRAETPQRRMRDVYERMSTGRSSRSSSKSSARSNDASSRRSTPRAAPRSSSSRGGSQRSTAPRRGSSSSRQKATTPSRGSSPRPSVTPRRSNSGGGSRATTPSRSRSGGGSKASRPSSSRSGGGSKASRPSSSRSGRSGGSKASRPSSRSGGGKSSGRSGGSRGGGGKRGGRR